jgi:putative phosphoribosyl transferase
MVMFADRADAGRRLARRLATLPRENLVVLGLPRGGVPVAFAVAEALDAPLDVIVVRKLGVPVQPELAMGAIGEDDVRVVNREVVGMARIDAAEFAAVEARERTELARRAARFRGPHDRISLDGRTALIVDDGIATGSTVRAACEVARAHGAARVIVAAPIAPPSSTASLREVADDVIVLESPESFSAIGQFYRDFTQTSDEEVVGLLQRARSRGGTAALADAAALTDATATPAPRDQEIVVDAGPVLLPGHLTVPAGANAVVVFAHGSGSSRHSPRNRFVADVLNQAGLGTLLLDLLTPVEERDRRNVFDIELLARRLVAATRWLRAEPGLHDARIGYFGASTGAGAALWASTDPEARVAAIVSRGGRPDLAAPRLESVRAPTLLIVGGDDHTVLDLNRQTAARMRCETALRIVAGATHLFEEPGTLARAADLARDWFVEHLGPNRHPAD